jgi:hypothetical protein
MAWPQRLLIIVARVKIISFHEENPEAFDNFTTHAYVGN